MSALDSLLSIVSTSRSQRGRIGLMVVWLSSTSLGGWKLTGTLNFYGTSRSSFATLHTAFEEVLVDINC